MWKFLAGNALSKAEKELAKALSETEVMKTLASQAYRFMNSDKYHPPERYDPNDPRTFHLYVPAK